MTHASQLPVTVHQALSVYENDAVEIVNKTLQELTPGPEQLEIWFLEGCERFKEATGKSYTKATALWRQAAEFGHVESQFNLADCYFEGEGVDQNPTLAVYWWQKAAEREDADAQNALGECYWTGVGVKQDALIARDWWERASQQNQPEALYRLGCWFLSMDVGSDGPDNALNCWKSAAELGNPNAQFEYAMALIDGIASEKDSKTGIEWLSKAVGQG